jgi:hypothetical protein
MTQITQIFTDQISVNQRHPRYPCSISCCINIHNAHLSSTGHLNNNSHIINVIVVPELTQYIFCRISFQGFSLSKRGNISVTVEI